MLAWLDSLPLWQLGLLLFLLFWAAAFVGRWLHRERRAEEGGGEGLIVSASLGLLALLLGFTVSMAVGRYDQRRATTVNEANAIGTFLYRADLMPPGERAATHVALERYTEARLQVGRMGETADGVQAAKSIGSAATREMWQAVLATRTGTTDPAVEILVVEAANAMFDAATLRDASLGNRLPPTLVLLLLFFPVASLVLIGYVSGKSIGVHLMASTELILLLTFVLLLIADLNSPRSGTIRVPLGALTDVQQQLREAAPSGPE